MINKWGAKILGRDLDITDWREELAEPFDPYVKAAVRNGEGLNILCSSEFAGLKTSEEVRQRAIGLIKQINGIMHLQRGSEPLRFDGVVEFRDDQILIHHFVELEPARSRARGGLLTVQIIRNGVVLPPPPPSESRAQALFKECLEDDVVADIFAYIADAIDWYELYKVIELCERRVGGEHSLIAKLGKEGVKWKNARATANFFRHARAYRPDLLMPFGQAKGVILSGVHQIFDGDR